MLRDQPDREQGGVEAASLLATPSGWQAAGRLRVGDRLLTLGSGPLPITARVCIACTEAVLLPAGALGNRADMVLPADQRVAIDSDLSDDPVVMLPLRALVDWRGITLIRSETAVLCFHLPRPEVIYAGPGLLLSCAGSEGIAPLPDLSGPSARQLVACLIGYEAGRAMAQAALRAAKRL
jgi:hypothetical protein